MTKNYLLLLFAFFSIGILQSQTDGTIDRVKITESLTSFFKPDRENIHLHLNKSVYLNDEKIWFKGYIIEKKSASPYGSTSNVYAQLLDEKGAVLKSVLLYAENGTFQGYMELDRNFTTASYYLQVYTNYMNNFAEDESSVYKISIVNPSEGKIVNTKKINYDTVDISFFPESGIFLQGTSNTIGIKISDCNNNGITVTAGEIFDASGNLITTFTTNQFGFGKFDILSTGNNFYKAKFEVGGKILEKSLPLPQAKGVTLSVNNYGLANKTVITVKTNAATVSDSQNNPLAIVIHKADAFAAIDVPFPPGKLEKTIIIPTSEVSEGISAIYLVDKNLKKLAERVIFTPFASMSKTTLNVVSRSGDSIRLSGISPLQMASLSISVLPAQTLSETSVNSIYSALLLDNNLTGTTNYATYFLNEFSRKKHFELDNLLLTKKSKYNWDLMVSDLHHATQFSFDSGLTIKGTINTPIEEAKDFSVQMSSIYLGLNETTTLNNRKEFIFNNVMAIDSSTIHFTLFTKKTKTAPLKMFPQLLSNNQKFIKTFKMPLSKCGLHSQVESAEIAFPIAPGVILLDDVTFKGKSAKTDTLVNNKQYGNSMSRAYKITDDEYGSFRDILGFISAHGFDVLTDGGNVTIRSRGTGSFSALSPEIYLNDSPITDVNQLLNYSLSDVDEIYVNKRGYGGGGNSAGGIIRIYTKRITGSGKSNIKINSQPFIVINGFQQYAKFENQKYDSVHTAGFKNFGTIHWIPEINTNEMGSFRFSIPNLAQKKVRIHIEGIASDGKLISETIDLEIP